MCERAKSLGVVLGFASCLFLFSAESQRAPTMQIQGGLGREEVIVANRSFIPAKQVKLLWMTFAGDDRGFSERHDASSRTSILMTFRTDRTAGAGPLLRVLKRYGETRELDSSGRPLRTKTATTGIGDPQAGWTMHGGITAQLAVHAQNPLTPSLLTPPIYENVSIQMAPNGVITVVGEVSEYPSFELNVKTSDEPRIINLPISSAAASPLSLVSHKNVFAVMFLPPSPPR
jgi:hypothetical protein